MDQLKGYESGAVDYVSVPVVPGLLRAKVRVFAELSRKSRELERLNRDLESRVARRTEELEAAVAKQMELTQYLKQADRRKDEFLAQLAHELRNPLAPMRNATSILKYKVAHDPELVWCHDVIERQAKQLTRLVDDLLDVSRITRGKITLRIESVDLNTIVAEAVETSQPIIDSRRHQLNISLPESPVVVHADAARLTQVVSNLLNNAAKFQKESGRIDLRARRDGNDAVITVKDHGFGMTEEVVAQVFEPFFQGERDRHHPHDGLGIGLSLVKQLVELQGGTVLASSPGVGQGSEFTVRLPCNQDAGVARQDEVPGSTAPVVPQV
jgi:signal transduction histidine kinase